MALIHFASQYARARERQAEVRAEENVDISDNDPHPVRARIRVDARKWVASKLLRKVYGDRQVTELMGKDGGPIGLAPAGLPIGVQIIGPYLEDRTTLRFAEPNENVVSGSLQSCRRLTPEHH